MYQCKALVSGDRRHGRVAGGVRLLRVCRVVVLACLVMVAGQAGAEGGGLLDRLSSFGEKLGISRPDDGFLEPDRAFVFAADVLDDRHLSARWDIAEGYYLYRDKFSFRLLDAGGVELGVPEMPEGELKEDEAFGLMEVYYGEVRIRLPLRGVRADGGRIVLEAGYQGCADAGYCYPPMKQTVGLLLPEVR